MADNTTGIVAIELLAACQGVEFHRPMKSSPSLESAIGLVRSRVPAYTEDRYMAPDIEAAKKLIAEGAFRSFIPADVLPSAAR